MSANILKRYIEYETWYAFKKDLQSNCGHPIPNDLWLRIKPPSALPWDKADMRRVLLKLRKDKSAQAPNHN